MRVLVLTSVYPNARQPLHGIFVARRVRALARLCEIVVVAPVPWFPLNRLLRGAGSTDIPREEIQDGIAVLHPRFFSVPGVLKSLDGFFYFLSIAPVLWRLRRRFRFDLIDAHFAYPDGLAACLLGKVFARPVTVTLRGTIVPLSRFRLRRRQIAWTLDRAVRIFSVSGALKQVAVSLGAPPDKVRVVLNGVDPGVFRPSSQAEARRRLFLPAVRPIVLSIGALSPRKGHQRVVEALPAVLARYPELLYVVVGGPGVEGDTGPLLRRRIAELGLERHVLLVGFQPHDEISRWLAAADVFCLATSNEGLANVVHEALAAGVPVVTTRVGGHAEVVHQGENGFLVDVDDREALTAALVRALDTRWDRAAIARSAASRTWDRVAAEVHSELVELAASPHERAAGVGAAESARVR